MTLAAQDNTPRGLVWAFASVSSVAIHIAVVAALLTAAHFATPAPPETQISIATLESAALGASAPLKAATVAPLAGSATALPAQSAEPERIAAAETAKAVSGKAEPDRIKAAKTVETAIPSANLDRAQIAPAADIARPAEQAAVAAAVSQSDPAEKPPVAEPAAPVERTAAAAAVEPAAPAPVARAQSAIPDRPAPAPSVARAEPAPPAISVQRARPAAAPSVERVAPAVAPVPAPQVVLPPNSAAPQAAETVAGPVPAPARPAQPEDRSARIARFLRSYEGGGCFLAVAAGDKDDPRLQIFSDRSAELSDFRRRSAGAFDVDAEAAPVGEAQCLALRFARRLPRYPDFGLRIELDSADVASGASLAGRVANATASSVYLLLVDDEGMVQRADRFLTPLSPGNRRFAVPMVLTDPPKTPTQLLIALASDRPVDMLEALTRAPAADFFTKLKADDSTMDFAIAAFEVR